ncbi:MAG: hypothetical protein NUW37_14020 [Planctomycetes bacterium]|nr:hypothetical protein [Planctomycetota bacterium]
MSDVVVDPEVSKALRRLHCDFTSFLFHQAEKCLQDRSPHAAIAMYDASVEAAVELILSGGTVSVFCLETGDVKPKLNAMEYNPRKRVEKQRKLVEAYGLDDGVLEKMKRLYAIRNVFVHGKWDSIQRREAPEFGTRAQGSATLREDDNSVKLEVPFSSMPVSQIVFVEIGIEIPLSYEFGFSFSGNYDPISDDGSDQRRRQKRSMAMCNLITESERMAKECQKLAGETLIELSPLNTTQPI